MNNIIQKISIIIILSLTPICADNQEFVPKELVKTELTNILKAVKKYKKKNETENRELRKELEYLKRKFKTYKLQQKKKIKVVTNRLQKSKEELKKYKLHQSKKVKLVTTQLKYKEKELKKYKSKHNKKVKKKFHDNKRKTIHKIVKKAVKRKERIVKKEIEPILVKERVVIQKIEPLANIQNMPWVEIVVEGNINIYQLALKYYGDKEKYREIYAVNQNLIGNNFKLYNGMSLKIPMTNQFEEQPMILNRD